MIAMTEFAGGLTLIGLAGVAWLMNTYSQKRREHARRNATASSSVRR